MQGVCGAMEKIISHPFLSPPLQKYIFFNGSAIPTTKPEFFIN
jgi:hypothetical protein